MSRRQVLTVTSPSVCTLCKQGDEDDEEVDGGHLQSPAPGSSGAQIAPWSSKREQLKAKLQSYQAQLRIAKSQGIARRLNDDERLNDDDAHEATGSRGQEEEEEEEEEDLHIHSGAGKAELEVAGKRSSSHHLRAQKLQDDIQTSLENIKKIESSKQMESSKNKDGSSGVGSSSPLSNAPVEAGRDSRRRESSRKEADSLPYAGVFPRSDDDLGSDGAAAVRSDGAGTERPSAKKTGVKPAALKPIATDDELNKDENDLQEGSVDEEDALMLAEERVRQAYAYAGGFAIAMCLMSVLCFVFGIFMPWGFSVWSIAVPLGVGSGYFLRYCYPLAINSHDMPQSLAWVSIVVIYVSCFLFFSGILSASASLSIGPILSSPFCTGLLPPPHSMTPAPVAAQAPVVTPKNTSAFSTDQNGNPTTTSNASNSTVPQAANVTASKNVEVNELCGLDADTLVKFGACKGWNMCQGKGIKMLTCAKLKAFNDWNAFFFFVSCFLVAAVWMWIYYIITVRLHEMAQAIATGDHAVLDCSLPACIARIRESLSMMPDPDGAQGDHLDWDEEGSHMEPTTKFQADGPFRDRDRDVEGGGGGGVGGGGVRSRV